MTVHSLFPGGVVSREQHQAMHDFDRDIARCIDAAKAGDVPQGLIVALLHGHAHQQTAEMVGLA